MFRRAHHNAIHKILGRLNTPLFEKTRTFFGGGTAIVLKLGEYRESLDIDFLCADLTGYRQLRNVVWKEGFLGLFKPNSGVREVRDTKTDQYGIRNFVETDDVKIKLEIVSEARVLLDGDYDEALDVPILTKADMFTEKLLANADRVHDASSMARDVIDLAMMIDAWGDVPGDAMKRASEAYGRDYITSALSTGMQKLLDPGRLDECARAMEIDAPTTETIRQVARRYGRDSGRERLLGVK